MGTVATTVVAIFTAFSGGAPQIPQSKPLSEEMLDVRKMILLKTICTTSLLLSEIYIIALK